MFSAQISLLFVLVRVVCCKNTPFFKDFILQQLNKLLEYEKTSKKEGKIGFLGKRNAHLPPETAGCEQSERRTVRPLVCGSRAGHGANSGTLFFVFCL